MNKIRVMLVDDHSVVRAGLRLLLESEGDIAVVGEATDGVEAVAKAKEIVPDVIVMDIMMPNFDGYSTLLLLKHDEQTRDVPVIMLTSVGKREKVVEAFRDGAAEYVLKPFRPDMLLRKIDIVLNAKKPTEPPPPAADAPPDDEPDSGAGV